MDVDWHSHEPLGRSGDRDPGSRQEGAVLHHWEPCPTPSLRTVSSACAGPARPVPRLPEHPTFPSSSPAGPSGPLSGKTAEAGWSPEVRLCGLLGKPHSYPWLCTCPLLHLLFARLVPSHCGSQIHRDTLPAPFRAPVFFLSWNFAP